MPDGSGVALKTCTKCGEAKPETEFYVRSRGSAYSSCKGCTKKNVAEWQRQNPDKYGAARKKNHELKRQNPEWLASHRLRMNAAAKRHGVRPGVKQKRTIYSRASRERSQGEYLLTNAKRRSRQFGRTFDLDKEWARTRWTGNCELTKIPFVIGVGSVGPFSPSIDRIDAALGYTKGNCRFVLSAVNSMKGAGTDQDVYHIAEALIRCRESEVKS